jgi:rod shape-determining protein MreC
VSSNLSSKVNKERAILVIVPLLIFQLALLSLQIQNPSGVLLFKSWTLTAQAPVVNISSSIYDGLRRLWFNYVWMVGARAENKRLQERVRQLALLNDSYEQVKQENARLRRLLSLNDNIPFKTVGARVIARNPSFLSNVIYVDRGSVDGVRIDVPVLSGEGIIGRTVLVSRNQSQIQLISNPDASIGVMMESSRTPGVLKGSGDFLLDLNYIGNTEPIKIDDVVLTSGLDGIFPKGLIIGRIVESHKGTGVFRALKVKPVVDLIRIEEVSILLLGS